MSNELTTEQQATNFATMRHIERVRNLLGDVIHELLERARNHDQSKLESPEVDLFAKVVPIAGITYDSPEYAESKKFLASALDHHYARNRHHPEHHKSGIDDMNLIDIIEMLVDWKAASERHNDGNILKSIEKNADRFKMSPQLVKILESTAKVFWI